MELGLDGFEQCWDRVGLGEICFEGQEAVGGVSAVTAPGRDGDLVPVAEESLGDGGTDSGAGTEDQNDRLRCHCALVANGRDQSRCFWAAKRVRYGMGVSDFSWSRDPFYLYRVKSKSIHVAFIHSAFFCTEDL